jgi:DeoR family transcriptional regulator, fructose operon transcriptional repressor
VFAEERRRLIEALAREAGRVDASELAHRFAVTTETVRRDLIILEREGVLRRVHGGAMPIDRLTVPNLIERRDIMTPAKLAIGRTAAKHLPESGAILIDAGTTTACLAEAMPMDRKLSVVTNGLPIASMLTRFPALTVFVLGGRVRMDSQATVEDWALSELALLDVDVAFMATSGLSVTRGFSTPDPSEAAVKRAMIKSAKRSIVLADSSKVGVAYMSVFAELSNVDLLITDSGIGDAALDGLRSLGLKVEVADDSAGAVG